MKSLPYLILVILTGCQTLPDGVTFERLADSPSMEPSLPGRSFVLLDHDFAFEDLRSGMVVVYRPAPQERIIHRIKEKQGNAWVVQGDNNRTPDRYQVTESNFESVLVGWGRGVEIYKSRRYYSN